MLDVVFLRKIRGAIVRLVHSIDYRLVDDWFAGWIGNQSPLGPRQVKTREPAVQSRSQSDFRKPLERTPAPGHRIMKAGHRIRLDEDRFSAARGRPKDKVVSLAERGQPLPACLSCDRQPHLANWRAAEMLVAPISGLGSSPERHRLDIRSGRHHQNQLDYPMISRRIWKTAETPLSKFNSLAAVSK